MQLILVLMGLVALVNANLFENRSPGCNADNCLRALEAQKVSVVARPACSSFMTQTTTVTITPPVLTVTSKQTKITSITLTTTTIKTLVNTVITTAPAKNLPVRDLRNKRSTIQSVPTLPTYASACSSLARFSSACSCLGITAATLTISHTLPVSSKTVISTATAAATFKKTNTVTTLSTRTIIPSVAAISTSKTKTATLSKTSSTSTYTSPSSSPDPLPAGQFYVQIIDQQTNSSRGYLTSDGSTSGFDVPYIGDTPIIFTHDAGSGRISCDCPIGNDRRFNCWGSEGFGVQDSCEAVVSLFDNDYLGDEYYASCRIDQTGLISCDSPPIIGNEVDVQFYSCVEYSDNSYLLMGMDTCGGDVGCTPVFLYADGLYNYGAYN